MAVQINALTSGEVHTGAPSTFTTASVSPNSGRTILLSISNGLNSNSTPATISSVTGNGLARTLVATKLYNLGSIQCRCHIYKGTGTPSAGTITVNSSIGNSMVSWSLAEFYNVGSNGLIQNASNACAATSCIVTLAAFASAQNATYCAWAYGGLSPAAGTPGSGFSQIHRQESTHAGSILTEWKSSADTSADASWGANTVGSAGIAIEIDSVELTGEAYLKGAVSLENLREEFIKASPLLSYPESYLKFAPVLEKLVEIYMRFGPAFQIETGNYLKSVPMLQREVFPYLKFEVAFPEAPQWYLKAASSMQARGDHYIRAFAQFAITTNYLKVRVALSKQPIIGDLGDGGPANKVGLLSRQYLSVASVKKDVT